MSIYLNEEFELMETEEKHHNGMRVTVICPACEARMLLFIVPKNHITTIPHPYTKMVGMGRAYSDCENCKMAGRKYRFEAVFTVALNYLEPT